MDEFKKVRLGSQAEMLLQTDFLNDAFAAIEEELVKKMLATTLTQTDVREGAYLTMHGLRLFKATLAEHISAKNSILELNELKRTNPEQFSSD